jgi:hypothetical protein
MVAVLLFFAGFLIAGFLPLPGPGMTMAQVATMYQTGGTRILAGMVVMMASGMFMAPTVGVISQQMDRIPGVPSALSYAQIAAGACGIMFFFLGPILFMVTAYRPERPAEITYMLNDASWIVTVLPWPPAFMENVVIGVAILFDKGPAKVFPRWVGWMNFFVALGFLPGTGLLFVTQGPFAWNSLYGFWVPGSVFGVWFMVMTWALLKAIGAEERVDGRK